MKLMYYLYLMQIKKDEGQIPLSDDIMYGS